MSEDHQNEFLAWFTTLINSEAQAHYQADLLSILDLTKLALFAHLWTDVHSFIKDPPKKCLLTGKVGQRGNNNQKAYWERSAVLRWKWAGRHETSPCQAAVASEGSTSSSCFPQTLFQSESIHRSEEEKHSGYPEALLWTTSAGLSWQHNQSVTNCSRCLLSRNVLHKRKLYSYTINSTYTPVSYTHLTLPTKA